MADEEDTENVYQPEPTSDTLVAESLVRDALSDAQVTVTREALLDPANEAPTDAKEFLEEAPAESEPAVAKEEVEALQERGGERSRQDSAEEERGPGSAVTDEAPAEQDPGGGEEVVAPEELPVPEMEASEEEAPAVVEIAASEEVASVENEYSQQEDEAALKASQDEGEELETDESAAQIEEAFEEEEMGLPMEQDLGNQEAPGFIEGSEEFFRTSTTNVDQSHPVAAKPKSKTSKMKSQEKGFTSKVQRHSVLEARRRDMRPVYPNGPYRAKPTDEVKIAQELRRVPNPHDYFGYLFSYQSQRPPNYYYRYILPVYKQPLPRQHMCITGERVPTEKIHREKTIHDRALPMSTLKVRWRSSRLSTVYKLEDLYAYLTIFGEIDGVYSVSVNSALVVFSEIESARAVIMCPCLGFPWDPLIAEWVEPRMNNFGFYNRYLRLEEPVVRLKG